MIIQGNHQYFGSNRPLFPLFFLPAICVLVMIGVMLIQDLSNTTFYHWGIFPRTSKGLRGILFAPFIHGSWSHLVSNAVPLLLMGFGVFYYFSDTGYKVFFWLAFSNGLWVWSFARASYHVGASGMVYGLAVFLVLSAMLKRNRNLLFFSLVVIFLYGGMVWGVFPVDPKISWESHLMGAMAGAILAYWYRKEGVVKETIIWDEESELSVEEQDETEEIQQDPNENNQMDSKQPQIRVVYHFKKEDGNN
ncbi:MAG: rhomboid family intramembrane serine protease [Bacteroidota bacterium]|jgi:membrane associated rhomboid family serine protease